MPPAVRPVGVPTLVALAAAHPGGRVAAVLLALNEVEHLLLARGRHLKKGGNMWMYWAQVTDRLIDAITAGLVSGSTHTHI